MGPAMTEIWTLARAREYFLEQWPTDGPSAETVRTYSWQLKWLVRFADSIGKGLLADLTPDMLRAAMREKRSPAGHPPTHKGGEAAANSLACAARAMSRWLVANGIPAPDVSSVVP